MAEIIETMEAEDGPINHVILETIRPVLFAPHKAISQEEVVFLQMAEIRHLENIRFQQDREEVVEVTVLHLEVQVDHLQENQVQVLPVKVEVLEVAVVRDQAEQAEQVHINQQRILQTIKR